MPFAAAKRDQEDVMQLHGIHHLTAVTADARGNHAFYTQIMGLRLVKKTVNQDDVSAYHLFYADAKASPGTDITFFDWPVGREVRGSRTVTRTAFRVNGEKTLGFWRDRLKAKGVAAGDVAEVDGRLTLAFEDFEGQRLALVDDGGDGEAFAWEKSPVVAEHQIRGLGPITLTVPELSLTAGLLTDVMNMRRLRDHATADGHAHVFTMGLGGAGAELHVIERRDLAPAQSGAGGVHHVAFRTPGETQYHAWTQRLDEFGVRNSGEIDRFYFRSLYFREPGGVLFEIATDGPGFATDEPAEKLGERLALPPFLEPKRKAIEAGLKPL
jgi:glyoxalase family protein